jgi:hypothetical protein
VDVSSGSKCHSGRNVGGRNVKAPTKRMAVFLYNDDIVEVAVGRLTDKGSNIDVTRLESGMSFLQVKASTTIWEKLRKAKSNLCVNHQEIAHTSDSWSRQSVQPNHDFRSRSPGF